jgi:hypothetical protein
VIDSSATVQLRGNSLRTLVIDNPSPGTDFLVTTNSQLIFDGGPSTIIHLTPGSTGEVYGHLEFITTANQSHYVIVETTGGLIIRPHGSVASAPVTSGAGSPFGPPADPTSLPNSVIFEPHSVYYHGGNEFGRSPSSGAEPFGLPAPLSFVVFETDSVFIQRRGSNRFSGQNFPIYLQGSNTNVRLATQTLLTTFGELATIHSESPQQGYFGKGLAGTDLAHDLELSSPATDPLEYGYEILGNFTLVAGRTGNTAPIFSQSYNPSSGNEVLALKGQVFVEHGQYLDFYNGPLRRIRFHGTTPQTADFGGAPLPNLEIQNPQGVTLSGLAGVLNSVSLAPGASLSTTVHGALCLANSVAPPPGFTGNLGKAAALIQTSTMAGTRTFDLGGPLNVDLILPADGGGANNRTSVVTAAVKPGFFPLTSGSFRPAGRSWYITSHNFTFPSVGATLVLRYLDTDYSSQNESQLGLAVFNYDTSVYEEITNAVHNTANNSFTIEGLSPEQLARHFILIGPAPLATVEDWSEFN